MSSTSSYVVYKHKDQFPDKVSLTLWGLELENNFQADMIQLTILINGNVCGEKKKEYY